MEQIQGQAEVEFGSVSSERGPAGGSVTLSETEGHDNELRSKIKLHNDSWAFEDCRGRPAFRDTLFISLF